jgi:hypothetical protein
VKGGFGLPSFFEPSQPRRPRGPSIFAHAFADSKWEGRTSRRAQFSGAGSRRFGRSLALLETRQAAARRGAPRPGHRSLARHRNRRRCPTRPRKRLSPAPVAFSPKNAIIALFEMKARRIPRPIPASPARP